MQSFDISSAPLEIERKFLIRYPDLDAVRAMPDYSVIHIEQTYLLTECDFPGGRVRKIVSDDGVRYIYTCKQKISEITRREYEKDISFKEYSELLEKQIPETITIIKDRHRFSYSGLCYELDVYSFWDDRATLESEVESEDTPIPIPPCVELIREVTFDRWYNNSQLSKNKGDYPL